MNAEIAVARTPPAHPVLDLATELAGVPKPVLRTVFGKHVGRLVWELTRKPRGQRPSTESSASAVPMSPASFVEDALSRRGSTKMASDLVNAAILQGMIEYLSRRAAETLEQNRRLARLVTLTLCYDNGSQQVACSRLARPTAASAEICEAAERLFRDFPAGTASLISINLTNSSIKAQSEVEVAPDLTCALAGASS